MQGPLNSHARLRLCCNVQAHATCSMSHQRHTQIPGTWLGTVPYVGAEVQQLLQAFSRNNQHPAAACHTEGHADTPGLPLAPVDQYWWIELTALVLLAAPTFDIIHTTKQGTGCCHTINWQRLRSTRLPPMYICDTWGPFASRWHTSYTNTAVTGASRVHPVGEKTCCGGGRC